MVVMSLGQSLSPGNEQHEFWTSGMADTQGSRNYAGIKDPVVDALVEAVISAPDRHSLVQRTRALDRVLLWGHYVVPQWYKASPCRGQCPTRRYGARTWSSCHLGRVWRWIHIMLDESNEATCLWR